MWTIARFAAAALIVTVAFGVAHGHAQSDPDRVVKNFGRLRARQFGGHSDAHVCAKTCRPLRPAVRGR